MKSASASSPSDLLSAAAPGPTGFSALWVQGQAEALAAFGHTPVVMLLMPGADGILRPDALYPGGASPSEALRAAAMAVAEAGKPALRAGAGGRIAAAVAIRAEGLTAVAGAELSPAEGITQADLLRALSWGAKGVAAELLRAAGPAAAQAEAAAGSNALALLGRALDTDGYRDALRVAATELALTFGAERVAIARGLRRGARIEAISHASEFRRASRAADLLAACADAALDQGALIVWPARDGDPPLDRHPLEAMGRETGAASILTLPMGDPEDPWGAIAAEFATPEAARAQAGALQLAGDALAPLFEVKRRNDRWWITRAFEGGARALGHLVGPRALGWKLAAALGLGLGLAAATVQAPARVTAEAAIASEGRVLISAPFDGFLSDRLVRAGQEVRAGELLLTLDERELTLEKLRHEATLQQSRIELDAAAAERDRARMSVLAAEARETEALLRLTEARLEAGRIRAPFAGVVASDATEGRVGAPLGRGEELMSLAPLDDFTVTLFVPDAQVDRVTVGQAGVLRLASMPEAPLTLELTRVTPMTEARDGENAFRARARLTGAIPADLTHGMEGVAKLTVGRQLWIATWGLPLYERLRLRLWSLWP